MKIQLNEIKRMQQLAGLITESQLNENNFFGFSYKNKNKDVDTKKLMAMDEKEAFQIARKWMEKNNLDPNEIQSMKQLDQYEIEKYDEITESQLNELSPELLARAGEKAQAQGRKLQANKFSSAANAINYKAAQAAKDAKLEPVKPFVGKELNLYFDVQTDKGLIKAIGIPFKIQRIYEDTNGALIIELNGQNNYKVHPYPYFFFLPEKDHFTISSDVNDQGKHIIQGMDKAGANTLWKLAKAFKPDTQITSNTLIMGQTTPLAGTTFTPYQQPQAESIEQAVNEALKAYRKKK